MYTILHNPRCRKSRETLALLQEKGIDPEIILYLESPQSQRRLKEIAGFLGLSPIEFTRTKEKRFKELGLSKMSSDAEILKAMAANPILIERPIVIRDNKKAAIGRPPENVLALF